MTNPDTVIVGAGSAGCVLAARLSEDGGHHVVLLEAGPAHLAADIPDELRYLSRPVAWPYEWGNQVESSGGRTLKYARGRGLGGSSAINGGVALRAERPDLDTWPPGWQWDNMLPCFNRVERDFDFPDAPWHGSEGPIPIVRWPRESWTPVQAAFHAACVDMGYRHCADHNQPGTTGVGPIPMNRIDRSRVSAHAAYLEPAHARPNLTVLGETMVDRLLIDHGRVTGVRLAGGDTLSCGRVILCAGVIQNPLLLWRSGIGPGEELRRLGIETVVDLPAVGSNLSDHMVITLSHPIDPRSAPADGATLQNILRATAPSSDRQHDLQLTPYARRPAQGPCHLEISVALQLPVGTGSVIPTGPDPSDPAHIAWPFTAEAGNVRRLAEGWRLAVEITIGTGLSVDPNRLKEAQQLDDGSLVDLIGRTHTAFYHGVGTCRMGTDDGSVVDPGAKVRGVASLAVVDASIIPTVPRTNTNLTVMALAERAAELLR